jgi:hypothetical protein
MTDTQAPDVVVTEADREEAWGFRPDCYFENDYDRWHDGAYDDAAPIIKAFARHRLSTQSAMQSRIEELEAALQRIVEMESILGPTGLCAIARATLSNIGGSNDG